MIDYKEWNEWRKKRRVCVMARGEGG